MQERNVEKCVEYPEVAALVFQGCRIPVIWSVIRMRIAIYWNVCYE